VGQSVGVGGLLIVLPLQEDLLARRQHCRVEEEIRTHSRNDGVMIIIIIIIIIVVLIII
jgi:hypothetical protein